MKSSILTVVLALCFSTAAYAAYDDNAGPPPKAAATPCDAPACTNSAAPAPCENPPCTDVTMGPPANLQTVEKDEVGAVPPIDLQPVGVQTLPPADPATAVPTPAPKAERPATPRATLRHYGAGIDVGFPDGAALDFYWRPARFIRSSVAATYNTLSEGFRIGLTYLPFETHGLSGTLEGGYYFDGNANKYAGSHQEPVLDDVGYGYANFHLGWDWGQTWGTFFIHGGMSYVHAELKNLDQQFNNQVLFEPNPTLTAWVPSVKLGLIFYF